MVLPLSTFAVGQVYVAVCWRRAGSPSWDSNSFNMEFAYISIYLDILHTCKYFCKYTLKSVQKHATIKVFPERVRGVYLGKKNKTLENIDSQEVPSFCIPWYQVTFNSTLSFLWKLWFKCHILTMTICHTSTCAICATHTTCQPI